MSFFFFLTSLYNASASLVYESSETSGSCFNFSLIFGNSYFILNLSDLRSTAFSEYALPAPSVLISHSKIGKKFIPYLQLAGSSKPQDDVVLTICVFIHSARYKQKKILVLGKVAHREFSIRKAAIIFLDLFSSLQWNFTEYLNASFLIPRTFHAWGS